MSLAEHAPLLLRVAHRAIRHGVERGAPLEVACDDYPEPLRELRASFVTLHREGRLRGCTGHLEASLPLVADVARSAHQAALADPRFPPVREPELAGIQVHVSVLGPLEPLPVGSRQELLAALRPGMDGLVLREGPRQGTFLPSVWETLPEPERFVEELLRKAGLAAWSPDVECLRYEVEDLPGA